MNPIRGRFKGRQGIVAHPDGEEFQRLQGGILTRVLGVLVGFSTSSSMSRGISRLSKA